MRIPLSIRAGDSRSWLDDATTDNLGNAIQPGTWSLTYSIRGPSVLDLVATVQTSQWLTSITAAQSIELSAGLYYWQAFATKGADRFTLGSGRLEVLANLVDADINFDGRTQLRKDLDAVQTAIRQMVAGGAVQKYVVGSREVQKMPLADLIMLESRLKAQVAAEEKAQKIANGEGNPHNLFVRFK